MRAAADTLRLKILGPDPTLILTACPQMATPVTPFPAQPQPPPLASVRARSFSLVCYSITFYRIQPHFHTSIAHNYGDIHMHTPLS